MGRKTKEIEQPDQNEMSEEARLSLHKIMGQVAMATFPGATVSRLIHNAANNVELTPEWEAFRNGALEEAGISNLETQS